MTITEFTAAHAAECQWIAAKAATGWEFPVSLQDYLSRKGCLTDGQLAAVRRLMAGDADRGRLERPVDVRSLEEAFQRAADNGLKRPALYLGDLRVAPAGAASRNAGALYVKRDGHYLGKVQNGGFHKAWDCSAESAAEVVEVLAKVTDVDSLKTMGKLAGRCCCCGRELTDPASIAAGIGPVCEAKWS